MTPNTPTLELIKPTFAAANLVAAIKPKLIKEKPVNGKGTFSALKSSSVAFDVVLVLGLGSSDPFDEPGGQSVGS